MLPTTFLRVVFSCSAVHGGVICARYTARALCRVLKNAHKIYEENRHMHTHTRVSSSCLSTASQRTRYEIKNATLDSNEKSICLMFFIFFYAICMPNNRKDKMRACNFITYAQHPFMLLYTRTKQFRLIQ